VDLHELQTIHQTYHDKYRNINEVYAKNKNAGKKLYARYKRRERNRTNQFLRKVAKYIASNFNAVHGFEKLAKQRMFTHNYHRWNRELSDTDWRKILFLVSQHARTKEIEPYYTSKTCSRCGGLNKALSGDKIFECKQCGLRIDRQFNASINLYQRMRGASHDIAWFDRVVLRGGLPLIEAEMNPPDEPAREGNELVKPQVHVKLPMIT